MPELAGFIINLFLGIIDRVLPKKKPSLILEILENTKFSKTGYFRLSNLYQIQEDVIKEDMLSKAIKNIGEEVRKENNPSEYNLFIASQNDIRQYLKNNYEYVKTRSRFWGFMFKLENKGKGTATDLKLKLICPRVLNIWKNPDPYHKKPNLSLRLKPFESKIEIFFLMLFEERERMDVKNFLKNLKKNRQEITIPHTHEILLWQQGRHEIIAKLDRLNPGDHKYLAFYIEFSKELKIFPPYIEYEITANDIPKKEGKILKIE